MARILGLIALLAIRALPQADGAGILVVRSAEPATVGATTDNCRELAQVECQSQRGPCLLAIREGSAVEAFVASTRQRWPEVATLAAEGQFAAVLALPIIFADGRVIGSLGLYSYECSGFSDGAEHQARAFAEHAAIVLQNAADFTTMALSIDQLQDALASRDIIATAKGILVERHKCSVDDAFDILRRNSQSTNRKLRDVATALVQSTQRGTTRASLTSDTAVEPVVGLARREIRDATHK
jgi:GAF domain-containing protein